jgi:hypothetical protein
MWPEVHPMPFMIVERFKDNGMLPAYKRVRDEGRVFPDGLNYVDSWVEPNFSWCFQLLECDDLRLLQQWILKWRGSGVGGRPLIDGLAGRSGVDLRQTRTQVGRKSCFGTQPSPETPLRRRFKQYHVAHS